MASSFLNSLADNERNNRVSKSNNNGGASDFLRQLAEGAVQARQDYNVLETTPISKPIQSNYNPETQAKLYDIVNQISGATKSAVSQIKESYNPLYKYNDITSREDFEQNSRGLNADNLAREEWLEQAQMGNYTYGQEQDRDTRRYMDEEQNKIYNYLYNTEGKKAAEEYYSTIQSGLWKQKREHDIESEEKLAKENPVGSWLLRRITHPAESFEGIYTAGQKLLGKSVDENDPLASSVTAGSNTSFKTLYDNTDNPALKALLVVGTGATDMLSDVFWAKMFSPTPAASRTVASALGASNAFSNGVYNARQRGLTEEQSMGLGLVEGVATYAMRQIGYKKLIDALGKSTNIKEYILNSAFAGAESSAVYNAVDFIGDTLIAADKSVFNSRIQKYISEGYSEGEAFARAIVDEALERGKSVGLSGLTSAGAALIHYMANYKAGYSQLDDNLIEDKGLSGYNEGEEALRRIAEQSVSNGDNSNTAVVPNGAQNVSVAPVVEAPINNVPQLPPVEAPQVTDVIPTVEEPSVEIPEEPIPYVAEEAPTEVVERPTEAIEKPTEVIETPAEAVVNTDNAEVRLSELSKSLGTSGKTVMKKFYDPSFDVDDYAIEMRKYYVAGMSGEPIDSVSDGGVLTSPQKTAIYEAGEIDNTSLTKAETKPAKVTKANKEAAARRLVKAGRNTISGQSGRYSHEGKDYIATGYYIVRSDSELSGVAYTTDEMPRALLDAVGNSFTTNERTSVGKVSLSELKEGIAYVKDKPKVFTAMKGPFAMYNDTANTLVAFYGPNGKADTYVNANYLRDIISLVGDNAEVFVNNTKSGQSPIYIKGDNGDAIILPVMIKEDKHDESTESNTTDKGTERTTELPRTETTGVLEGVSPEDDVETEGERGTVSTASEQVESVHGDARTDDGRAENADISSGRDNQRGDLLNGAGGRERELVNEISEATGKDFEYDADNGAWTAEGITLKYNSEEDNFYIAGVEDGGYRRTKDDVIHLINGTRATSPLDDIPEKEMVRQVSEGTGLDFKYRDELFGYESHIGPKNSGLTINIKYGRFSPGISGGRKYLSYSIDWKDGGNSGPADSIEEVIERINSAKEKYLDATKKIKEAKKPAEEEPNKAKPKEDVSKEEEPKEDTTPAKEEGKAETVKEEVEKKVDVALEHKDDYKITKANYNKIPTTPKERYNANIEAVKTVKKIIAEGRPATTKERNTLALYSGWGGLANMFDSWREENKALKEIFTDEEYNAARSSVTDAYFTEPDIINAIYDGLKGLGFDGGRVLEPSMGVGRFIGLMPSDLREKTSAIVGVEKDYITGNIAKYLYPSADIKVNGFEKVPVPANYFDVVVGNVPFGDFGVYDPAYKKDITSKIHNYFLAKAIDSTRTGGVVCLITSKGTLDSQGQKVREYIAERADLIGAIRLPDSAFKSTGTSVVTDILVFKKRAEHTPYAGEPFIKTEVFKNDKPHGWEKDRPIIVNEYFNKHDNMIIGETGATYRYGRSLTVTLPEDKDLGKEIKKAFKKIKAKMDYGVKVDEVAIRDDNKKKKPAIRKENNKIFVPGEKTSLEVDNKDKKFDVLSRYCTIRDTAHDLLQMQEEGASENEITKTRNALNKEYDEFVKKYKSLHAKKKEFLSDPDVGFVMSLEKYDKKSKKAEKADILTKDLVSAYKIPTHADTIEDAVSYSMNTRGKIDTDYIANLCDLTKEKAEELLTSKHLAFRTSDDTFEYSRVYLSGNVRNKLRIAESLAANDKRFEPNVKALKDVLPEYLTADKIQVALGMTWIPPEIYAEFANELLGFKGYSPAVALFYNNTTGLYSLEVKNFRALSSAENLEEWGTREKSFIDNTDRNLLMSILNSKNITVTYSVDGKTYVNEEETTKALEKAAKIKSEFSSWFWGDVKRRETFEKVYNDIYNSLVPADYNGVDLELPGLSAKYSLYDHQKRAIARVVYGGGNTLLAHRVGAGKTLEMICSAMKLKQLGIIKKPMFVVPKKILNQWANNFRDAYPSARVHVVEAGSLSSANAKESLSNIVTNDYDAIVIHYDNFSAIPMSEEYTKAFKDSTLAQIEQAKKESNNKMTVNQLEKFKKNFERKIDKLIDKNKKTLDIFSFEQLGVDSIFVDEAQNFKNLFYFTSMTDVYDMGTQDGSIRAFDLYMKTKYLRSLNGGRGLVFATATPIMNALPEAYTMQRYLQEDLLEAEGLQNFDAWAKQYADITTIYRVNPSGTGYELKSSMSHYKNLPEFEQMWTSMADTILEISDLPYLKIPEIEGGEPTVIESEPSKFQSNFMKKLAERAKAKSKDDHIFKIMGEGRLVTYTQRFFDDTLPYEEDGKINNCVREVARIYKETDKDKGTQVIFCDRGVPGSNAQHEVPLYQDIKNKLIGAGIPAEEIKFVHDAKNDEAVAKLYESVNEGKVRVLIGSSSKLGEGVNIQRRAKALHAINPFSRPGDWEQVLGRVQRQGNMYDKVIVNIYVTKQTYDTHDWDAIKRKGAMINQVMAGTYTGREADGDDDTTKLAGLVAAVAADNPLVLKQHEVSEQIKKLEMLQSSHTKDVYNANKKIRELSEQIPADKELVDKIKKDISMIQDVSGDNFKIVLDGKTFDKTNRSDASELLVKIATEKNDIVDPLRRTYPIGKFAGFDLYVSSKGEVLIKGNIEYSAEVNFDSAEGTMTRTINLAKAPAKRLEAVEERLNMALSELPKYEKIAGSKFDKLDELIAARAEEERIKAELLLLGNDIHSSDSDSESEVEKFVDVPNSDRWTTSRNKGGENRKPMSLSEIVARIEHDYGLNITTGHIRSKDARGQFNKRDKGIRTRITNDLPTIAHELGHAFDDMYGITSDLPNEVKEELKKCLETEHGLEGYNPKQYLKEGFAEYMRKYLTNKDYAMTTYPAVTDYFFKKLSAKDMVDIDALAEEINAYLVYGINDTSDSIRLKEEGVVDLRTRREKISDWWRKQYTDFVDSNRPLKEISENAYILATNSAYTGSIVGCAYDSFLPDPNGKFVYKSLKSILSPIDVTDKKVYRDLNDYVRLRHGIERVENGKRVFANDLQNNPAFMKKRLEELDKQYPVFKQIADDIVEFEHNLVQTWAVDTGILPQETFDKWNKVYKYHVPLYRVTERISGGRARKGYANQASPFKRAKGSGADIVAPIDNIMDEVATLINVATRNNVALALREEALKDDSEVFAPIMEKIPTPLAPKRFDAQGLKAGLHKQLDDNINKFGLEAWATVDDMIESIEDIQLQFERGKAYGDVITILVDGKPEYWKVNDTLTLESITSLTKQQLPYVLRVYGSITRFLTANITGNNPIWSIFSNAPRDLGTFMTYTKDKRYLKAFKAIGAAYLDSIREQFTDGHNISPLHWEYKGMGGGHDSLYSVDSDSAKKARNKITSNRVKRALSTLNPINFIAFITDSIENGPREATYILLRNAGLSPQEAFYESRDITVNFGKAGANSRQLGAVIPFFNASVQGIDKMIRYFSAADVGGGGYIPPSKGGKNSAGDKEPRRFSRKEVALHRVLWWVAVSAILAILFYALNNSDEESEHDYELLSTYTKNSFFVIPIGNGKHFAIPKPREIAILMSFFERMLEATKGQNENAFDDFYDYVTDNMLPSGLSDLFKLPSNTAKYGLSKGLQDTVADVVGSLGILGVGANLVANRDFLGRPIVSQSMSNQEPRSQYTGNTSALAYYIGQLLNVSPQRVDYFGNQVFGYWWKIPKAIAPVDPNQRDLSLGVANSYVKSHLYSTDVVNNLYDEKEKSEKIANSDKGNVEKAITSKYDTNMTTFYSRFNSLNKNSTSSDKEANRGAVIDMINDYLKARGETVSGGQKEIESVVKATGDTSLLPAVMTTYIKDSNKNQINLSDKAYYEYQTIYNDQLYSYIEQNITTGMSDTKKAALIKTAKKEAKASAEKIILARYS